jgi:hypothetical protein
MSSRVGNHPASAFNLACTRPPTRAPRASCRLQAPGCPGRV